MRRGKGFWLALVFVLAGVFVGNRVGEALGAAVPALASFAALTVEPRQLSLLDLGLQFGFSLRLNAAGVLGGLAGIALARRV